MKDLSADPLVNASDAEPRRSTITVDSLEAPYIVAHRGGVQLGPEHAMATYQAAVKYTPLIEQDVNLLPDGTLAIMHDDTVSRTATGTGEVINFPPHQWKSLTLKGSTYHKNYPDIVNGCLTLDEVFVHFLHQDVVFVVEAKPRVNKTDACAAVVALARQYKLEDRVIIQGWDLETLQPALDAGFDAMYLWSANSTGVPTPSAMVAAGVKWAAPSTGITGEVMQTYVNAGLKLTPWTLHRQYEMEYLSGYGVQGCFSNDPAYMCGDTSKYQRKSSNFGAGIPDVGMSIPKGVNDSGAIYLASRDTDINSGTVFGTDTGGYISSKGCQFQTISHGYLCPLPNTYTLKIKGAYDTGALGTTRWFSIYLGLHDTNFMNGDTGPSGEIKGKGLGYHILFRNNGVIDIYKVTNDVAGSSAIATASGSFPASTWIQCTVTVSPTKITASNGTATATTTDTAHRPLPYVSTLFNRSLATVSSGDFYIADLQIS